MAGCGQSLAQERPLRAVAEGTGTLQLLVSVAGGVESNLVSSLDEEAVL